MSSVRNKQAEDDENDLTKENLPVAVEFVGAGLAGIVTSCAVHPFDLVKTRMQMVEKGSRMRVYKNMRQYVRQIAREEGLSQLYRGVSAALMRQAIFTTVRVAMYVHWRNLYVRKYGREPDLVVTTALTTIGSAVGSVICTPAEVVLVRMTYDGLLPPAQRRNYRNVFDGLKSIMCAEGVPVLFRGIVPTTCRAVVGISSQSFLYTGLKSYVLDTWNVVDGVLLQASVGAFTGLITCVLSLPFDMVKTRIQAMRVVDGRQEYHGSIDVMRKVCRQEGVLALWKGFVPYFLRPHTVFLFVFVEELRRAYRRHVNDKISLWYD